MTLLVILLANTAALAGVLWLGWRSEALVLLYLLETVAVALFSLLRELAAGLRKPSLHLVGVLASVAILAFLYGGFLLLAFVFILAVLVRPPGFGNAFWNPAIPLLQSVWPAAVVLVIPHGWAFVRWLQRTRDRDASVAAQGERAFFQILLTLLVVGLACWAAERFGNPFWAAVVVIILKTAVDLLQANRRPPPKASAASEASPV